MIRCCAWIALLCSACSFARFPPAAPPRQSHVGLTISTLTLGNGQRVVLVKDPHAYDVQVTMRFRVGAIDDGDHPGIAHFVEHLMFEQSLDGQPLFTHFEDTASWFNAYTGFDATTFVSRGPAAQLEKLLDLEAARLTTPCESISEAAFVREREVVVNELNERNRSTEVYSALHGVLYPERHPYRTLIGGTAQSVGAITREQACAFAAAYYSPSNAVLVVSGNIGDRAQKALTKIGAVAAKGAPPKQRTVKQVNVRAAHVAVKAPIDQDVLVLAWPLPVEAELQVKVRAVASMLTRLVDSEIKGAVVSIELGDSAAPMFGLAMVPADGETLISEGAGMRRGVEKLPSAFTEDSDKSDLMFERVRSSAIYSLYSSLEDGSDRDIRLAGYVLAGRDPNQAFAQELRALQTLTRQECAHIATNYLGAAMPAAITLTATASKKSGEELALRKPFHDIGQRRTPPDPALARKPADAGAPQHVIAHKTRTLPNGLAIVLLPASTVPTVEMRLIFRTGTADEPVASRGLASLTAHALTWDLRHLRDVFRFAAGGGLKNVDVGADRTTFSVQGMGTQFDVLLAGLRRLVREGTFDEDSAQTVVEMRRAAKRVDDEGMLTDTWRAAVFGSHHPYARAGIARHTDTSLTLDDAAEFRALHYTPANATLVIAGSFDPVLAEQWIDYLFADWTGRAAPRAAARSKTAAASIGKVDDLSMVQLRIALPVAETKRAEQLVAAEMLAEIARDVRFELAAGYSVDAQLSERRLARHYVLAGWVDAPRVAAAVELIRDRVQRLRADADTAARAFVTARKKVLGQLVSRIGSASWLATRVEQDIELERDPMSELQTAASVQALTIEAMTPTLAELDLSRATVMMRGPRTELASAFAKLGRKESYVMDDPFVAPPGSEANLDAPTGTTAAPVRVSELQPALTARPPTRFVLTAGLYLLAGYFEEDSGNSDGGIGKALSLHGGYRVLRGFTGGLRVAVSDYTGSYDDFVATGFSVRAIDAGAFGRLEQPRGGWLELSAGLHLDRITDTMSTRTNASLGYGAALGRDIIIAGPVRFGGLLGVNAAQSGSFTVFLGILLGI